MICLFVLFLFSSFQTIPHDNERDDSENESESEKLGDDARIAVGDSNGFQEFLGPPVVAILDVAHHFRSIEPEDRLHGPIEGVLDERHFKHPMPHSVRVSRLDEEVRE